MLNQRNQEMINLVDDIDSHCCYGLKSDTRDAEGKNRQSTMDHIRRLKLKNSIFIRGRGA